MTTTTFNSTAQTFRPALGTMMNLRKCLLAYSSYRKFKALNAHFLNDMGLTQADRDATTFRAFLTQPQR